MMNARCDAMRWNDGVCWELGGDRYAHTKCSYFAIPTMTDLDLALPT